MYKPHTHCRACGYAEHFGPPGIKSQPTGEKLIKVFDLGLQPPANNFCQPGDEREGFAPLEVMLCPRCSLAQLSATVRPDLLYQNYAYVTSKSKTMHDHFNLLWQLINLECRPEAVVEIGSNDGDFLQYCRENGAMAVCGIDPAENLVKIANNRGLTSLCGLFDEQTSLTARSSMPPVDVVVARHVFCHVDDWRGFIKSLDALCQKETLVVIEVPYAEDLLKHQWFDTIYHEHLSYFTLHAMKALLENGPFRLQRIQHFPIHGGSLVVCLRRRDSVAPAHPSVGEFLENEFIGENRWREFASRSMALIADLREQVKAIKIAGKSSVVGLGASAKSTVWMHACGFSRWEIPYICDCTPGKWNRLCPGTDIPIVDDGALLRDLPAFSICFAWNFRKDVLDRYAHWREKGGKFIFPVPKIEFV